MPDRFLREGLLNSATFDALSDAEQMLFVRLLLIVDDYGTHDGREASIANKCWPIRQVDLAELTRQMITLHTAGLIIRYSNAGKLFIGIPQWRNDLRGYRKFPAPPIDLDVPGQGIRWKFGGKPGWTNPHGSDAVSILLDAQNRATIPQPPEWRDALWIAPRAVTARMKRTVTQPTDTARSDSVQTQPATTADKITRVSEDKKTEDGGAEAGGRVSTPPPTNGDVIDFNGKEFIGLTEAKRLGWQGMVEFPVPDQIERAAAWLAANAGEREAIRKRGDGFEAFIVRWLLREARPKH